MKRFIFIFVVFFLLSNFSHATSTPVLVWRTLCVTALAGATTMLALGGHYMSNEWKCPQTLNGTKMNKQCCSPENSTQCWPAASGFDECSPDSKYCELDGKITPANYEPRNLYNGAMLLTAGLGTWLTSIPQLMSFRTQTTGPSPAWYALWLFSLASTGFSLGIADVNTQEYWQCNKPADDYGTGTVYDSTQCCDSNNCSIHTQLVKAFDFHNCTYGQTPYCVDSNNGKKVLAKYGIAPESHRELINLMFGLFGGMFFIAALASYPCMLPQELSPLDPTFKHTV